MPVTPFPAMLHNPVAPAAVSGACTVQKASHRLLRRTAHCLAPMPGDLRFVLSSHPGLVGLPESARMGVSMFHHASFA